MVDTKVYTERRGNNMGAPIGTAVAKWGNAPAIRIPKSVMQKANLHEGDSVDFEVQAPGVIIVRLTRSQPTLEDLVAGITPQNRHKETAWGKPEGIEVW